MYKPFVLIPSYNTGSAVLEKTVREALAQTERPVWVVIDGSDDGSELGVLSLAESEPRLRVIAKPVNQGKGAAVRTGSTAARQEGFTHALVMDADGQHPADLIDRFLEAAEQAPRAMVLGQPVFDETVPLERLYGRQLSVWLVRFEVLGRSVGDPLYGFRVYPVDALLDVMQSRGRSNRYDFDPEVAVRLNWQGVPSIQIDSPVKYLDAAEGGVSHFHYLRDNARYVALHTRLILEAPYRWLLRAACRSKRGDVCN